MEGRVVFDESFGLGGRSLVVFVFWFGEVVGVFFAVWGVVGGVRFWCCSLGFF